MLLNVCAVIWVSLITWHIVYVIYWLDHCFQPSVTLNTAKQKEIVSIAVGM